MSEPAPPFDQPLAALVICHQRIAQQLVLIERLPAHMRAHGADQEAQRATEGDVRTVSVLTAALRDEHVAMEEAWDRLRPALVAIAAGETASVDAANFIARYRSHMAREESELFPLAKKLLTAEDVRAMGEAMAARRGLSSA